MAGSGKTIFNLVCIVPCFRRIRCASPEEGVPLTSWARGSIDQWSLGQKCLGTVGRRFAVRGGPGASRGGATAIWVGRDEQREAVVGLVTQVNGVRTSSGEFGLYTCGVGGARTGSPVGKKDVA